MRKMKFFIEFLILISISLMIGKGYAGELKWEESVNSAFLKAMSEKKMVLLFVGRDSCGECRYMRTQVFESEKPAIKKLLEDNFILWFSDVDESTEWHRTARGLSEIPLPLICIIDPESNRVYEDRSAGIQHSPEFYSRLLKYIKK